MEKVTQDILDLVLDLNKILEILTDEEWKSPTAFKQWTPEEVVAHLFYFDRMTVYSINFPEKFNLKLKTFFGGYSIILEPFSEKDENILRNCRDELSSLLKIKFENHQRYTFHITLAYILRELNEIEIKNLIEFNKKLSLDFIKKFPKITFTKPEMCTFEDMLEFKSINPSSL